MTIDRLNIPYECSGGRHAHLPGVVSGRRKRIVLLLFIDIAFHL